MKKIFLIVLTVFIVVLTATAVIAQEIPPLPAEIQKLFKKEGKLFDTIHDDTYFPTATVRLYWNTKDGGAYMLWTRVKRVEGDNIEFLSADSTTVLSVVWTAPDGVHEWHNFPLETTLRVLQEKYFEELDKKSVPDNSREKIKI